MPSLSNGAKHSKCDYMPSSLACMLIGLGCFVGGPAVVLFWHQCYTFVACLSSGAEDSKSIYCTRAIETANGFSTPCIR